jgi:ketosteroid isomerase-like protein
MRNRITAFTLLAPLGVIVSCASPGGGAQPARPATPTAGSTATDSASAHAAAHGFLAAFDSLQFDRFRGYFAGDITMFFPFPQFPARVDGKAGVEGIFGRFMAAQREAREKSGRPMVQGLTPRSLTVQMAGRDAAVVSFQLGADETPARRSLVFRRDASGWKVVHWHASAAPQAQSR